ncbi:hypothetical protein pb186bvf_013527 [Paramecium bursaria]
MTYFIRCVIQSIYNKIILAKYITPLQNLYNSHLKSILQDLYTTVFIIFRNDSTTTFQNSQLKYKHQLMRWIYRIAVSTSGSNPEDLGSNPKKYNRFNLHCYITTIYISLIFLLSLRILRILENLYHNKLIYLQYNNIYIVFLYFEMFKVKIRRQDKIIVEKQFPYDIAIKDIFYQIDPNHHHPDKTIAEMIIDLVPQTINSPPSVKDTAVQNEPFRLKAARVMVLKKQNQNQEKQTHKEVPLTNRNLQTEIKTDQIRQHTDNQIEQDQDDKNLNDYTTTRNGFQYQQQLDQELQQKINQVIGSLQAKQYEALLEMKNEQIEQTKKLHLQQIENQMEKQKCIEEKCYQELFFLQKQNQELNQKIEEQESELINLQITLASYAKRMAISKQRK